ncbi:uncharacterized protein A4U43_C03F26060 [Asparagus officinalis]|uniref:SURF1-like protein n=1 Tax=Asparagus officinalis TaxID=4686 RepID=A0A5P1FI77_ASPOF|nr:uncharacterized protein A4U43_C03F26060 [Asparagus officinalis]
MCAGLIERREPEEGSDGSEGCCSWAEAACSSECAWSELGLGADGKAQLWGCNDSRFRQQRSGGSRRREEAKAVGLGGDAATDEGGQADAAAAWRSSEGGNKERAKWSRSLLFVPGAITFGLGTWQILRRQEKVEMLEYRRKRLEMEPIVWNKEYTSSKYNSDSLEFRRVFCEGYFDEGKSIYVGPRSRSISGVTENGYYIITPLIPKTYDDNNSVQLPILVNRGWVPRGWRDKPINDSDGHSSASRAAEVQPNKETLWWKFWAKLSKVDKENEPNIPPVRVIGVARESEKPSIFVPENDPKTGQWFYVDVPMIARACGLPEDTLYIEDINENASATNPYPVPKDVNTLIQFSVMPQDHRNYTITWYSLSAAVTYMAVKRIKPKKVKR